MRVWQSWDLAGTGFKFGEIRSCNSCCKGYSDVGSRVVFTYGSFLYRIWSTNWNRSWVVTWKNVYWPWWNQKICMTLNAYVVQWGYVVPDKSSKAKHSLVKLSFFTSSGCWYWWRDIDRYFVHKKQCSKSHIRFSVFPKSISIFVPLTFFYWNDASVAVFYTTLFLLFFRTSKG